MDYLPLNLSARLLIATLLLMLSLRVLAVELQYISRPDDEILILSVTLGSFQLNDGMIAYLDGQRVLLPFGELMQALDVPIAVEADQGTAEGWFRDESNRLILDIGSRILNIGGKNIETDWSKVELQDFDIYVESELIIKWLDLTFDIVLNASQVQVGRGQWLPLEKKLQRHLDWERLGSRSQRANITEQKIIKTPYAWLDWPTLDNNIRVGISGNDRGSNPAYQYDLLATGDMLRLNGVLSLNIGQSNGEDLITASRLQLQTSSNSEHLPQLTLGDFTAPSVPLLLQQQEGVGLLLSNFPRNTVDDFDRISLTGDALNGWDIEVYRNNELLAFTTVNENNRYQFDGIPLQFGLNIFRLVFYGPQGQRREKIERFVVGEDMVRQGEGYFFSGIQLRDRRLLPGQDEFFLSDEAVPGKITESLQAMTAYRYGLFKDWLLTGYYSSIPINDNGRHHYAGAQLQTSFHESLYDLTLVRDLAAGWASRISVQTLSREQSWLLEYQYLQNFISPQFGGENPDDRLRHSVRARWDNRIADRDPLALEFSYQRRNNGENINRASVRYSHRRDRLSLSKNFTARRETAIGNTFGGGFLLNYRREGFDLNSQINYELKPQAQLESANLTATWRWRGGFNLRATLRKVFSDDGPDRIALSTSWKSSKYVISVNGGYSTDGRYNLSLNLFSSLSRGIGSWTAAARSKTSQGAVTARVYLDHNGNGQYDTGDEPLPDVRFRVNSGSHHARTDAEGVAMIDNVTSDSPALVSILESSLHDPFWIPMRTDYRIQTRPGKVIYLDFPIAFSGEIDGTVYMLKKGEAKPVSNVQIQLLNADGVIVKEMKTAYDGFYLLDRLLPGNYQLKLKEDQLKRLRLTGEGPRNLKLSGNGDVLSGMDFTLTPLEVIEQKQ